MADFEIAASSEIITINGFKFSPGEADQLKAAASFAGGMRDFPQLPPQIEFDQFIVQFFEDGTLVASRNSGDGGLLKFDFDSVDELVTAINSAVGISIDKKRLSPSPRAVGDLGFFGSEDIIEGR